MTYTLKVWYAASDEDSPQVHAGLTSEQVERVVVPDRGFMSDLLTLKGEGVRKLSLEVER